jgi:hypothetical protein
LKRLYVTQSDDPAVGQLATALQRLKSGRVE